MSPAFDPSSAAHSPRSAARPGRGLASPWAHVVRGEPEAIPAGPSSPPAAAAISPPEPSDRSAPKPTAKRAADAARLPPPPPPGNLDHGSNGNADAAAASSSSAAAAAAVVARGKSPAWKVPSNGASEVSPVMGAVSWPALSESTRAGPKSSYSDSLKALSDGSVSTPAGTGVASPLPKPNTNSPSPGSTPNHAGTARQRPNLDLNSMNRGGGRDGSSSGTTANGAAPRPPSLPTSVELPQTIQDQQFDPEPSRKDPSNKNKNNWDQGSRSEPRGGGDQQRSFSGNRRGANGGGGSHHGSYGSRRGHGRGSYDWNPPQSINGRDAYMPLTPQQQRGHLRPFIRPPPPASAPFISPPPQVRPFVSPMGFPDMPPHVYYVLAPPPFEPLRNAPLIAHQVPHAIPPTTYFNPADHQRELLVKQIEYYFSSENLCKDIYLRQKMDDQGWVPISLISGFNRVKQLTNSAQYILDCIRGSEVVEVQGEKIRRRNDWMNWILSSASNQYGTSQSPATSGLNSMAALMQNVGVQEGYTNQNIMRSQNSTAVVLSRSASGNFSYQSQVGNPNGEGNGQVTGHKVSD